MQFRTIILLVLAFMTLDVSVRAASVTVDQSGQQFSEKSLKLKLGDTIVFANHDDVTHNITIIGNEDQAADLGLQKRGEDLVYKFDKTGRFKVRCTIHPSMKMTVEVN